MKNSYLETIRAFDGKVYNLSYHQKRYESVLEHSSSVKKLIDYLHPPKKGLYRCRLLYNNEDISVSYHEYKKKEIKSLKIIYDESIQYAKKSSNREDLDRLFNLREECDDILIVKNGLITDTSIANIAFFKDDTWYTPTSALLFGTTRQRFLDERRIVACDIKVEELQNFSKVALLNAMIDFDIITDISYKY